MSSADSGRSSGAFSAPLPACSPWLDAWLHWLRVERRASPLTLEAYASDLTQLEGLLAPRALEDARTADLQRALVRLHGAGLEGRSLARKLSAWRNFYRWLTAEGVCPATPVVGLKAPRAPRHLPKTLSPEEANRLLDRPADDELAVRDKAMFELFYSSGLRLSELAAIDVNGYLNLADGELTVFGKRGKIRMVPLGRPAVAAIRQWLILRPRWAAADEPALFVGTRGRRITPRSIQLRLDNWAVQAGLDKHVHPHMLRHSFASHLLQSSQDLRAVQELLGHASITATQVYTHLDFQHLAAVHDQAHPRARLSADARPAPDLPAGHPSDA